MKSLLLINVRRGDSLRVRNRLRRFQEVEMAYMLTGPYDLVAMINTASVAQAEAFGETVYELPGVEDVLPLHEIKSPDELAQEILGLTEPPQQN